MYGTGNSNWTFHPLTTACKEVISTDLFLQGEYTFYGCNDEAVYKAHTGLNIKGLRIIVICR
jgi:hypothetical protein